MLRPLALLSIALVLLPCGACAVVDRPLLGLRSVAGGIHNRRRAVGIRPFHLPDGRLGFTADGALFLAGEGAPPARLLPPEAEVDDPAVSGDGRSLLYVSGADQVTAGGGHNDHVWQVYVGDLAGGPGTRLTRSQRAELLPRFLPEGSPFAPPASREGAEPAPAFVFLRRPDYAPWELYAGPWGPAALWSARLDGSGERRLSDALWFPVHGLCVSEDGHTLFLGGVDGERERVFALEAGGEPRALVDDARLPALVPGGGMLYVGQPGGEGGPRSEGRSRSEEESGSELRLAARDGTTRRVLHRTAFEITALSVSPLVEDGGGWSAAFTELDPETGRHGTYVLRSLVWDDAGVGRVTTLHTLAARSPKRAKPLDVVMPIGWWFRKDECSPGSR